ncbi:hypothetical protein LOTGIDRAFT_165837 [Lottia gigantea]|uniref:Exonuclease domain-containing protein n=1 Tax=Lottia gigantea TaxID=225164 RepID=V4A4C0_LOTGI|nr:hypothetical protein LOTGIDRAFT_165837 [Lottia gigantea]ESO88101.1 hypothetical protein LOTGIDRAFT_165837 [Lottia gigantea]
MSTSTGNKSERLIWIDLEMSGLDIEKERIIEIAAIVTDADLNVIAEGPNIIIHQDQSLMDSMGKWCKDHHGASGLTKSVLESKISESDAENKVLDFLKEHTDAGKCPLAGNSIACDKMFLMKYMPNLTKHFHYRLVDVSTIKELCRRWYKQVYDDSPPKSLKHRALDDIKESIKELKYYREKIFVK